MKNIIAIPQKLNTKTTKIILYIMIVAVIISDFIYGIQVEHNHDWEHNFPISLIIKAFIYTSILCIFIFLNNLRIWLLPPIIITIFAYFHPNSVSFSYDFIQTFKLISIIYIYLLFAYLIKNNILKNQHIYTILIIITLCYSIPVLLGIFHIGFHFYPNYLVGSVAHGWKGFVALGNELAVLFLILFPVLLYFYIKQQTTFLFITNILLYSAGLLTTSKALLYGLTLEFLIIYVSIYIYKQYNKKAFIKLMKVFAVLLCTAYITTTFYSHSSHELPSGGIFSGRLEKAQHSISVYFNSPTTNILFGYTPSYISKYKMELYSEMDIVDTLITWGGIITCFIILLYSILVITLLKSLTYLNFIKLVSISFFIIHAILAGHALLATLATIPLGIILALQEIPDKVNT